MAIILRFDSFEVNLADGQIRKHGIRVNLRDQAFLVLSALLERAGDVVTREDLRRRLWSDGVFVDFDNNLNNAIARVREALGDSADHPRYIETLPKRGYRFIGAVSEAPSLGPRSAERKRLVVLPFVNLSGDPGQEYFSDAMTEEVITELAALAPEHLAVIARTTAMCYRGASKDVSRIGRELSVDHVVEGGVRRDGDHVAITVQLIRVSDQTHLFARRYDAPVQDVFELRTTIAAAIGAHLDSRAVVDEMDGRLPSARARRRPTGNAAAYNEYIQGRYLLERGTPDAMATARQHFEEALARDPGFALAHDALADFYSTIGYFGYMRPRDAFSIGITHVRRAVEADDGLAEAHAMLAEYHKQLDYDWPAAAREMARAIELDPASPVVRARNAIAVLMPLNRMKEAIDELRCALEWNPLDRYTRAWLVCMVLTDGQYEEAIVEARHLLELEPTSCWAHFFIGCAYRQMHTETASGVRPWTPSRPGLEFAEEAIREHLQAIDLSPGSTFFLGWLGLAYGACGKKAEARAVLQQLRGLDSYVLPTAFAHTHLGLGELDAAFEWFDRAVEERDQNMMPILSYGHFDPIRNDPRFAALVGKMKLAAPVAQL